MLPFGKDSHKLTNAAHDSENEKEVLQKIKEKHKPIRLSEIEKFARFHAKIYNKKVAEMYDSV